MQSALKQATAEKPLAPFSRAPRADSSLAGQVKALNTAFEEFKKVNDAKIKALEDRGTSDPLDDEQLSRINAAMDQYDTAIANLTEKTNALSIGGLGAVNDNQAVGEHSQAFENWFRRGDPAIENRLGELQVQAGLTTQSDPGAGFLVPTETSKVVDRIATADMVLRQLATVMTIGTDSYEKFIGIGGTTSGWVGEEQARPETQTSLLARILIHTKELYAEPKTTQKMLDDGITDIAQWLGDEVDIDFKDQEGRAFIQGNGALQPQGILTPNKVHDESWDWTKEGQIGYIPSGKADGFLALDAANGVNPCDALIDLQYALKTKYEPNASWLMNRDTERRVRKFKDNDGNYVFAPATEGMRKSILGRPLYNDDHMPKVGANAYAVAYGDFKRAYLIVDRIGVRVLRNPYKENGFVYFYTTKRVGGGYQNFEAMKLLKIATS